MQAREGTGGSIKGSKTGFWKGGATLPFTVAIEDIIVAYRALHQL